MIEGEDLIEVFNQFLVERRNIEGIEGKGYLVLNRTTNKNSFAPSIKEYTFTVYFIIPKRKLSNPPVVVTINKVANINKASGLEERIYKEMVKELQKELFEILYLPVYEELKNDSYAKV